MTIRDHINRHTNDDAATIKDSFLALLTMAVCAAGACLVDNLYL